MSDDEIIQNIFENYEEDLEEKEESVSEPMHIVHYDTAIRTFRMCLTWAEENGEAISDTNFEETT